MRIDSERLPQVRRLFAGSAGLMLLFPVFLLGQPAAPAPLGDDSMRVHFIDVGQGDATLLEFPCGTVLIDTGGEESSWFDSREALERYLDDFFDARDIPRRIDVLVLTHPHKDHTNNVWPVLSDYKPRYIVDNGKRKKLFGKNPSGIAGQKAAYDYAKNNQDVDRWFVLQASIDTSTGLIRPEVDPLDCDGNGNPSIVALWGGVKKSAFGWKPKDFKQQNNHSVVLRVDWGEASMLFTGDLEEGYKTADAGIESMLDVYGQSPLLDIDVYQVGHHGSGNGTSTQFLDHMKPKIAVISAGHACREDDWTAWDHGHPNGFLVDDLASSVSLSRPTTSVQVFVGQNSNPIAKTLSSAVYSTAWDGTVVLRARKDGWWTVEETAGPVCKQ